MDRGTGEMYFEKPQQPVHRTAAQGQGNADDRRRRYRLQRQGAGVSANREAILALADGRIFRGRAFGAIGESVGEVVFNTAMTGYQEVLTDPSYKGQIVCMTYPEIGNVGINAEDAESAGVHVEGFVVKEYLPRPSNWRAEQSLGDYLKDAGIAAIEGIDTRALVHHIRTHGAQEAVN